ncbi:hypothetical protein BTS2_3607 [Bacillus sp. TS-2]|nr:hypothetical protein BTS2_3607 [Bacillus sp. TS-2]
MNTNWNSTLYDEHHHFVSDYGQSLVTLLQSQKGEQILDLGCGTGDLTQKIAETGAIVKGVDHSPSMIQKAVSKYPNLTFEVGHACQLEDVSKYDAIFSNAVFHWIQEQDSLTSSIAKAMKTNGRLVVEFGGKGNVEKLREVLSEALEYFELLEQKNKLPDWYFPSVSEYTTVLEAHQLTVTFAKLYHRVTPLIGEDGLRNWYKMFTPAVFDSLDLEQQEFVFSYIEKKLKNSLYDTVLNVWNIDYVRLLVIAFK